MCKNWYSYSFTICQIGSFHEQTGKTPTNSDLLRANLEKIGIRSICASFHTLPLRRLADMVSTVFFNRNQYKVTVIHVYSGRPFIWAILTSLLAKFLKKRVVLWLHGGNLPLYYGQHKRLVNFTFKRADKILAPTKYLQKPFSPGFKVSILPYELPIKSYPYRVRKTVQPKLLWVRAFKYIYNPSMAPVIVKLLLKSYPDIALIMCGPDTGDGSFKQTLKIADELGVADKIRFPGLVTKDKIKRLGLKCDIFINTTNVDNTPVSVIEAMAMGMCVVSTNVGGIPFLIEDGHEGLLIPPKDPERFAKACQKILEDFEAGKRLSEAAHLRAMQFDLKEVISQWQKLLSALHFSNFKHNMLG